MATLFISDVHLSDARPGIVACLLSFLEHEARTADALYILGDFFDLWLGDDDGRPPHPRVLSALAQLAGTGVPVYLMHGNHDFLLGPGFERHTGCRLLPDPSIVELYGTPVLLTHGDLLCTDDEEYQAFRRYSRDPENQRRFLALPLAAREVRAAELRLASEQRSRLKPEAIMDVNPDAVAGLMREYGVNTLVHGHTHRPAVHEITLDRGRARRVVLGDWYRRDSVLVWNREGFRLARVKELPEPVPSPRVPEG